MVQTTWAYSDFHPSKWLQIFIPPHGRYASSSKTVQRASHIVQNPPCWIISCTGHKKRTRASHAWLFSVLDVLVHYLQEISDVSVSGSLSHFGQILANSLKRNSSKVMFTKRKLYRNSIWGNDSFPLPSWVYRHQWEKKTQILTSRNQYLNKSSLHEKTEIFGAT